MGALEVLVLEVYVVDCDCEVGWMRGRVVVGSRRDIVEEEGGKHYNNLFSRINLLRTQCATASVLLYPYSHKNLVLYLFLFPTIG